MKQPKKPAPKATAKPAKPAIKAAEIATPQLKNVTPAPDTTTAFLREIDEAMQQERLLAVWHKTKWFLLAAVVLLLLAVAGQQAYLAWKQHQSRTEAAQWYAFSQLKTDAERIKAMPAILQNTTGGTHALAVYKQAAMQHGAPEKAKAYKQIQTTDVPQWLKDIATLNAAIALLETDPAQSKTMLEVLSRPNGTSVEGPAFSPALELLALLSQQANDLTAAKGYTEQLLKQPGLPSDMRQRALHRYGLLGGTSS